MTEKTMPYFGNVVKTGMHRKEYAFQLKLSEEESDDNTKLSCPILSEIPHMLSA